MPGYSASISAMRPVRSTSRLGRAWQSLRAQFTLGAKDFVRGGLILGTIQGTLNGLRSAFRGLVGGSVDAGLAFDAIGCRLRAATANAHLAGDAMVFLQEETDRLGLSFRASATAFSGFLAAARGTRLEGEAAREIFSGVAEAARVMNLTAAEISGVFTALEQIVSKGRP